MLVLTRRKGESIMIGSEISVTILDVRGDQVRVGIDAPRTVKVHREEVFQQVAAANRAASTVSPAARALLQKRLRPAPGATAPLPPATPEDPATPDGPPAPA